MLKTRIKNLLILCCLFFVVLTPISNLTLEAQTPTPTVTKQPLSNKAKTQLKVEKRNGEYVARSTPVGQSTLYKQGTCNELNLNTKEVSKVPCDQGTLVNYLGAATDMLIGGPVANIDADGEINVSYNPGLGDMVLAMTGKFYSTNTIEPASVQAKNTVNEIMYKLNPVTTVSAQQELSTVYYPGLGYNILEPVRTFWSMNRNVSYGILIIIMFISALMLLFRRSLDGSEALKLNAIIPGLVFSVVGITFSYPYSGLFVDVITIGPNAVQYVLVSSPNSPGYYTIWNQQIESNPNKFTLIDIPGTTVTGSTSNANTALQIDDPYMSIWQVFGTAKIEITADDDTGLTNFVPSEDVLKSGPLGGIINGFSTMIDTSGATQLTISFIIKLVLGFTLIGASFRLFMKLLTSYLTLVLLPIVSPYFFLVAALPSMTGAMISSYTRLMLSAALSFVVVYAMFLLMVVLTYEPLIQNFSFVPPLLGHNTGADVGTTGTVIKSLIAYGLYISAPLIPDYLKESLGANTPGGFGAFGQEIASRSKATAASLFNTAIAGGQKLNQTYYPAAK